jgi:hypothetical protein
MSDMPTFSTARSEGKGLTRGVLQPLQAVLETLHLDFTHGSSDPSSCYACFDEHGREETGRRRGPSLRMTVRIGRTRSREKIGGRRMVFCGRGRGVIVSTLTEHA